MLCLTWYNMMSKRNLIKGVMKTYVKQHYLVVGEVNHTLYIEFDQCSVMHRSSKALHTAPEL